MSKGQATKQRISEVTSRLFNQKGFHGTSLSDIMSATGLEKGGIYNHFFGKEEIIISAWDSAFLRLLERFKACYKPQESYPNKITAMIDFYMDLWKNPICDHNYFMIGLGIYAPDISTEFYEKVKESNNKLIYILQVIIQEGMDGRNLVTDADAASMARFVFSTLNGSLYLSFFHNDAIFIDESGLLLKNLLIKTERS